MGCSLSGLQTLYDVAGGAIGTDVHVGTRRLRLAGQLGEGGFAFVYRVREISGDDQSSSPKHRAPDNLYALKKVLVQTTEQRELVEAEIDASSRFHHPNILPLLEHAIVPTKGGPTEAYLLFPLYRDGTLQDRMLKERLSPQDVLQIFHQICAGLGAMHNFNPRYAHNDVKPGNVLISSTGSGFHVVLMDFGSVTLSRRQIRTRQEALELQEWAAQHCSAPYRAPEFWDVPSQIDIDERTDIWSLGCTLYAIMCGQSPFEYSLGESGGSLQLAVMSGQIKWPSEALSAYPESFRQFVSWMLQTSPTLRPTVSDVTTHVEKLLAKLAPAVMDP